MKLSKTAYVILGMLKLGRRTGYEIKSLVDVSTRFFWAASYGQIYPELRRLEEAGLVTAESGEGDPRGRRAYELTEAGEEALRAWLTSSEPLYLELRHEGWLKFFFSDALEPDEQIAVVERMRAEHEAVRERLRGIEPAARGARDERGERFPYLTLQAGIAYQDAIIDWCSRMERELGERPRVTAAEGS
jgi:PadR family transcriptional regulator, regulatory protein AphA